MRLWIALCGGIVLEEALDLSSDRLLNNNNIYIYTHTYTCTCIYIHVQVSNPKAYLQEDSCNEYKYSMVYVYMYVTAWLIRVWFCNGSSPAGGRARSLQMTQNLNIYSLSTMIVVFRCKYSKHTAHVRN